MDKAIQKAIEGGWICGACVEPEKNWHWYKGDILLDTLFWQALGKNMGWSLYIYKNGEMLPGTWLYYWHCFIGALSEGKSIDIFFNEILK